MGRILEIQPCQLLVYISKVCAFGAGCLFWIDVVDWVELVPRKCFLVVVRFHK